MRSGSWCIASDATGKNRDGFGRMINIAPATEFQDLMMRIFLRIGSVP